MNFPKDTKHKKLPKKPNYFFVIGGVLVVLAFGVFPVIAALSFFMSAIEIRRKALVEERIRLLVESLTQTTMELLIYTYVAGLLGSVFIIFGYLRSKAKSTSQSWKVRNTKAYLINTFFDF